MNRKEKRKKIDEALKKIIIPFLREKGFKGSMPHFRRQQSDRINLLTFQHSRYESKFVVEIANCPFIGLTFNNEVEIAPNKITAHDMSHRLRLGKAKHNDDYWFDYGKISFFKSVFDTRANEIIKLWGEAEKWWSEDPYEQRNLNEEVMRTIKTK